MSPEGLRRLKDELAELRGSRIKEVAGKIEKAKEFGDLKENSEYHDAKDEMSMLMSRIRQIEDQIARAVVVEKGTGSDTVGIGSTVRISGSGREKTIVVVGAPEADPSKGLISNDSPLGKALIGRKVGETATINAPAGELKYQIIEID